MRRKGKVPGIGRIAGQPSHGAVMMLMRTDDESGEQIAIE
jgi:hypothetical protein